MSRLTTMSPEAIKQMFSPDADSTLITLVTFYDENNEAVARIADSYTQRVSEDAYDVVYGVVSRSQNYLFIPCEITLPSEEEANAPRCSITMYDVTKQLTPIIRTINKPLRVQIELVLSKSPDTVEISFDDFEVRGFTYNREKVTAELSMIALDREPFPMYSYTPYLAPGLF